MGCGRRRAGTLVVRRLGLVKMREHDAWHQALRWEWDVG